MTGAHDDKNEAPLALLLKTIGQLWKSQMEKKNETGTQGQHKRNIALKCLMLRLWYDLFKKENKETFPTPIEKDFAVAWILRKPRL